MIHVKTMQTKQVVQVLSGQGIGVLNDVQIDCTASVLYCIDNSINFIVYTYVDILHIYKYTLYMSQSLKHKQTSRIRGFSKWLNVLF